MVLCDVINVICSLTTFKTKKKNETQVAVVSFVPTKKCYVPLHTFVCCNIQVDSVSIQAASKTMETLILYNFLNLFFIINHL